MLRVVFMGSAPIAVPSMEYLDSHHDLRAVVTQPDRPQGRKRVLTPTAVKAAALARGRSVLEPTRLRSPAFLDALRGLDPQAIVVMAYGRLVPPAVLALPPLGCINLHGSILPAWRGPCPIERGLLHGDVETGITAFYMAEGFDTGDVILSEAVPIGPDDSGGSLREKLAKAAVRVLDRTLDLMERGTAPRTPQDDAKATHAAIITREEANIDWSRTPAEIDRLVRACDPEPGAWTAFRGEPLKVRRARPVPYDAGGAPGALLGLHDGRPVVAAAGGAVALDEVQPAGKRWMRGTEFAAGYRPAPGECLGGDRGQVPISSAPERRKDE